jgi:hypothetical protein
MWICKNNHTGTGFWHRTLFAFNPACKFLWMSETLVSSLCYFSNGLNNLGKHLVKPKIISTTSICNNICVSVEHVYPIVPYCPVILNWKPLELQSLQYKFDQKFSKFVIQLHFISYCWIPKNHIPFQYNQSEGGRAGKVQKCWLG